MSVDTYLKGKRTTGKYDRFQAGGVRVLVAKALTGWASGAALDLGGLPLLRRLRPVVAHQHHPT